MGAIGSHRVLRVVSLACLALSIGVTSAVFVIADGLFFRAVPFDQPDTLYVVDYRKSSSDLPPIAYDIAYLSERQRLRAAIVDSAYVASFTDVRPSGLWGGVADQAHLRAVEVDANFFEVFPFKPFRGSVRSADLITGIDEATFPIAVLGHALWQRLGHPDLGLVPIGGKAVVVVAILPPSAKFPGETNLWLVNRPSLDRPPTHVRLKSADAVPALASRVPELELRSLRTAIRPPNTETVIVLFFVAGLVVLMSWVQLAGLTVVDLLGRLRDLGVQLSLGATPRRIILNSVVRHALTAASVGAGSLLLIRPAVSVLMGALPPELTYGQYVVIDARAVWFVASAVVVGFGCLAVSPMWTLRLPPLKLMRGQVNEVARIAGLRRTVAIVQVAVGAALLYLTGLLGHSLLNAVTYDYGFDADDVVLFQPPVPGISSEDFEHRSREKGRLTRLTVAQLNRRRDVVAAATLSRVPMTPRNHGVWEDLRSFAGRVVPPGAKVYSVSVGRNFVSALGVSVVDGHPMDHADYAGRSDIALVNETFARMFGGSVTVGGNQLPLNIVGRPIETNWFRGTVVGVTRDLVFTKVGDPPIPQVFIPDSDRSSPPFVAIRTVAGASGLGQLRPSLEAVWGPLSDDRFVLLRDLWDKTLVPYRAQARLVGLLALFAIPLAAVGIASFMMFLVRADRRVTAIRLAIGAAPGQVRQEVLWKAVRTAALGVGAGATGGALLGKFMSARLFGVDALDSISLAMTLVVFSAVVVAASWIPGEIASRANPAALLRENTD